MTECLDWLLIFSSRHFEHVLRIYIRHYNRQRPHRALQLQAPERESSRGRHFPLTQECVGEIDSAGLLHEYYEAAACSELSLCTLHLGEQQRRCRVPASACVIKVSEVGIGEQLDPEKRELAVDRPSATRWPQS